MLLFVVGCLHMVACCVFAMLSLFVVCCGLLAVRWLLLAGLLAVWLFAVACLLFCCVGVLLCCRCVVLLWLMRWRVVALLC